MTPVSSKAVAIRPSSSIAWFALLCSLLGALWSLNLFPQGPLTFRIRTTVVLPSSRFQILEQRLEQGFAPQQHPSCLLVQKIESKELRPSAPAQPVEALAESDLPQLYRVTLDSVWSSRVDSKQLQTWLSRLTEPSTKQLSFTDTARKLRWVRYKLELAQRYQASDVQHLKSEAYPKPTIQSASYSKEKTTLENVESTSTTPPRESLGELDLLRHKKNDLESQLERERRRLVGTISISSLSQWTPLVAKDPLIIPIVGLVAGALLGMVLAIFIRSQTTTNQPRMSAYEATLLNLQIPLLHIDTQPTPLKQIKVSSTSGEQLRWWISGCEWSLLCWGLAASVRFAADPMWRDMCLTQPLLALARLFSSV